MFFTILRSQENDIVSDTKAIIETHVVENRSYNYSERIIKNTTTRFHHTAEKISKLTVKSINFHKEGFQKPYKTILSNGMNLE